MARLRMVSKHSGSNATLSLKENSHIAKSKRYKKFLIGLSLLCVIESIVIAVLYVSK